MLLERDTTLLAGFRIASDCGRCPGVHRLCTLPGGAGSLDAARVHCRGALAARELSGGMLITTPPALRGDADAACCPSYPSPGLVTVTRPTIRTHTAGRHRRVLCATDQSPGLVHSRPSGSAHMAGCSRPGVLAESDQEPGSRCLMGDGSHDQRHAIGLDPRWHTTRLPPGTPAFPGQMARRNHY